MENEFDVLLVEDTSTQAVIMKQSLSAGGYSVKIAKSAEDALDFMSSNKVCYVLTDINLPEMDGYELSRIIKAESKWQDVAVILLVTLKDVDDIVGILESKADNFMLKELRRDYFLSAFQRASQISKCVDHADPKYKLRLHEEVTVDCSPQCLANMLISSVHAIVHNQSQLAEA